MGVVLAPLVPGKLDAWKEFANELATTRKAEFDEFNTRMKLTAHAAYLAETPDGPLVVAYHEGPGADSFMGTVAQSTHPFDTWMRERLSEYHGIDFSSPPDQPMPQSYISWHAHHEHA